MSTTLFTFRIDAPPEARSVELRGSWDNFTHSYRMERDQRVGSRQWYGCFSFKDIVYDGEDQPLSNKRDGGLRMGGTYWYYYMLDGNYEWADPSKPSTTACPLLPGESLNFLEVPCDESDYSLDIPYFSLPPLSAAFTMDPGARFTTPRPNKFEALARKPLPPTPAIKPPVPLHDAMGGLLFRPLSPISRHSLRSSRTSSRGRSPTRSYPKERLQCRGRQIKSAGSSRNQLEAKINRRAELRHRRASSFALRTDGRDATLVRSSFGTALRNSFTSGGSVRPETPVPDSPKLGETACLAVPNSMDEHDEVLSDAGATMGYSCCAWKTRSRPFISSKSSKEGPRDCTSHRLYTWVLEIPDSESEPFEDISADVDYFDSMNEYLAELEQSFQDHQNSDSSAMESQDETYWEQRISGYYEHSTEDDEDLVHGLSELEMQGGFGQDATVSRAPSSTSNVSHVIPTGNILGEFVLPPSLTHDLYPSDNLAPALSPADPKTAGELLPPRTEPSLIYSPTCSSADTVSSWADEAFSSLDSSFDDMSDYGFSRLQSQSDSDSCELESLSVASPESPESPPTQSHLGGFQGYSLSSEYTASEVTLTKVSTRQTTCTIVPAESPMRGERLSVAQGSEPLDPELKDMVELVTDFGYLGEALL